MVVHSNGVGRKQCFLSLVLTPVDGMPRDEEMKKRIKMIRGIRRLAKLVGLYVVFVVQGCEHSR